jgi:thymidylate synthase ThyX
MEMIKATVIQDSIFANRITTFELEYPRFIHSELMTHRQFSRNAASSRAIPVAKMHDHILANMAHPIEWGVNRPGMQASEVLEETAAMAVWQCAGEEAVRWSKSLANQGLHKQIVNRVTEPFQVMKTVVTSTEWDNWYNLRNHADAQPEIRELAKAMLVAHKASKPTVIYPGEWHVPYVDRGTSATGMAYIINDTQVSKEIARKVSASCCAQVSYRNHDDSVEKAEMIFDKLITSQPAHLSPVEHQATPMSKWIHRDDEWPLGVTHFDRYGDGWSANFKQWIQFRQTL